MSKAAPRVHEVTFCAQVKSWAEALFAQHPEWPFARVEIEESRSIKRKRSDLRLYGTTDRLIATGEVKLPGTRDGWSPYAPALIDDANSNADNAGAEFFFTWNVNTLVLFDRKRWSMPLRERRVKEFPLGEDLQSPEDIGRPEIQLRIR